MLAHHLRKRSDAKSFAGSDAAIAKRKRRRGSAMNLVPLVLVGGPLGSGKTTLLQYVLENARGRRLGVIVNEFGDLSIDGALLKDSGADLVEVSNGCVCCAVGGDLSAAVHRVLRGREPDAIVVELSGVADPHPVLRELSLMTQW